MITGFVSMVNSELAESSLRKMGKEACLKWVKEIKICE